jgi:competence protein ComGF
MLVLSHPMLWSRYLRWISAFTLLSGLQATAVMNPQLCTAVIRYQLLSKECSQRMEVSLSKRYLYINSGRIIQYGTNDFVERRCESLSSIYLVAP